MPSAAWTPLDPTESIALVPGAFYAVVASVKANHAAADIQKMAAGKGLVLTDYAEQGQRVGLGPDPRSPDYKYVAAIAKATQAGSLRTSVPWPLSMVDDSKLVSAWTGAAAAAPTGPALPAPAPVPPKAGPPLWPLVTTIVAAGAFSIWEARRRKRRR